MNKELITIIPFATADRIIELNEILHMLPFAIKVVLPREWSQSILADLGRAIVVFISGEQLPSAAFCKQFKEQINIPKICILDNECIFKQRELVDCYNEVMTWPCSAEEISYRFSRLIQQPSKPKHNNSLNSALANPLIKLNLVGESPVFLETLALIQKAAMHDLSVLLQGETGTGKELAARAIHYLGPRSKHPFIAVNCGALPEEIFENEVFGHKQGAYTDAKKSQLGLVGQAQAGTLFLDEIDSLSLKSQVALLRFVQDYQYKQLGAQDFEIADVRLIAATNADLRELVKIGRFREDLYYRLNIIEITMPALRERIDDLPLLTDHLIQHLKVDNNSKKRILSDSSYLWMRQYPWPGNVRELENMLLRGFWESEDLVVTLPPPEMPTHIAKVNISGVNWDVKYNEAKSLVMDSFDKKYITHALAKTEGNISKAARLTGKERRALGKLIKKHGLKGHDF